MSYAIFQSGTKQHKVSTGEVFPVEKMDLPVGGEVVFDKVLLAVSEQAQGGQIGTPYLNEKKVVCEVVAQKKGPKVLAFKFRPKKHSKQLKGHRQLYTMLKVKSIV